MVTEVVIHIGGVHVSRQPTIIKTVLGSCIAVCIHDVAVRIGGMNHFMLPFPGDDDRDREEPTRFGVHAMDTLIDTIHRLGGDRRRLTAKLFGGAHVLQVPESENSVPRRNIRFIEEYMQSERISVLSRDLGGYSPRRVHFHTDTGKAFVKCLNPGTPRSARLAAMEFAVASTPPRVPYGPVILFDDEDKEK